MKKPKHPKKAPGVEKSSGLLDREIYILAKEWLMKIYRRPARICNRRTFK